MQRINVVSSNIKSIGYNEDNFTLEIEFNDNSIYQYINVPKNEYESIMNSNSHGKYLNENIKGVYQFNQIK
ncbi:MAG: KTSC domain-containing protein [Candidatus Gracilibacteria bacterium]|nr:KTSC domain-containing protein [Candidatus Gracilibacteria bacterium]MDQ7022833.1 KTSC domain-containing protein [Candidatus Gracilibacteria bacterium]